MGVQAFDARSLAVPAAVASGCVALAVDVVSFRVAARAQDDEAARSARAISVSAWVLHALNVAVIVLRV